MRLVRAPGGTYEIESPVFGGSITLDAAEELVERLGELITEAKARNGSDGRCLARIWHGPGHQSSTRCELEGEHAVHRAIYGEFRQEALWTGEEALTGFFDDPPEEPE